MFVRAFNNSRSRPRGVTENLQTVPFRGPSSSKYGGEWYDESDRPDLLGVMDGLPLTMVTCCNIKHTIGLANVDTTLVDVDQCLMSVSGSWTR
jgi:hypothetical protein